MHQPLTVKQRGRGNRDGENVNGVNYDEVIDCVIKKKKKK